MTVMLAEVYDALLGIGVDDAAARRAASAPASSEPRFAEISAHIERQDAGLRADIASVKTDLSAAISDLRGELRLLKWQVGIIAAPLATVGLPALWLLLRIAAKLGALPI